MHYAWTTSIESMKSLNLGTRGKEEQTAARGDMEENVIGGNVNGPNLPEND